MKPFNYLKDFLDRNEYSYKDAVNIAASAGYSVSESTISNYITKGWGLVDFENPNHTGVSIIAAITGDSLDVVRKEIAFYFYTCRPDVKKAYSINPRPKKKILEIISELEKMLDNPVGLSPTEQGIIRVVIRLLKQIK